MSEYRPMNTNHPNYPNPTREQLAREADCEAIRAEKAHDAMRILKAKQSFDEWKNEMAALLNCHVPLPVKDRCLGWLEDCEDTALMLIEELEDRAR